MASGGSTKPLVDFLLGEHAVIITRQNTSLDPSWPRNSKGQELRLLSFLGRAARNYRAQRELDKTCQSLP